MISPFASRYSYETLIVPTEHISGLSEMSDAMTIDLAGVIVQLFGAYEAIFSSLPYNMVFHGLPSEVKTKRGWPCHAHIHVYPRLNTAAGLELGSGTYINPTPPELATNHRSDGELEVPRCLIPIEDPYSCQSGSSRPEGYSGRCRKPLPFRGTM